MVYVAAGALGMICSSGSDATESLSDERPVMRGNQEDRCRDSGREQGRAHSPKLARGYLPAKNERLCAAADRAIKGPHLGSA